MAPLTFTISITPDEYAERKKELVDLGAILPDGNSGTISHDGAVVAFEYNGVDTLSLTVLHHPFIVSSEFVEHKIQKWFSAPAQEGN